MAEQMKTASSSDPSRAVDGVAMNSENLEAEGLIEEDVLELAPAVTEVAFLTRDGSAAKSDELAKSEKGNSKTAEEPAIVTEVAAEVLEEIQRGDREKAAEARGLVGVVEHDGNGRQFAGGDDTLTATKVQHSAPLVVHRWKWWNCCGLLDFVTNPDG